jgi:hypothetical protein
MFEPGPSGPWMQMEEEQLMLCMCHGIHPAYSGLCSKRVKEKSELILKDMDGQRQRLAAGW